MRIAEHAVQAIHRIRHARWRDPTDTLAGAAHARLAPSAAEMATAAADRSRGQKLLYGVHMKRALRGSCAIADSAFRSPHIVTDVADLLKMILAHLGQRQAPRGERE